MKISLKPAKHFRKHKIATLAVLAIFVVLVASTVKYYTNLSDTRQIGFRVLSIDHEPMAHKGSFYTKRDGTRIDLFQKDSEGNSRLLVRGSGNEVVIEDGIVEFGEHVHSEDDVTFLISSPDDHYAIFGRRKTSGNEVYIIDAAQNGVFRLMDTDLSDGLSGTVNAGIEKTHWIDRYFIYGGSSLLSLDIKNKKLYVLDTIVPQKDSSIFLHEDRDIKICGKKFVFATGWVVGYKQPRVDNPDRHGYLIVTDPNGKNRHIIKEVGYLSGVPETTCSYPKLLIEYLF